MAAPRLPPLKTAVRDEAPHRARPMPTMADVRVSISPTQAAAGALHAGMTTTSPLDLAAEDGFHAFFLAVEHAGGHVADHHFGSHGGLLHHGARRG